MTIRRATGILTGIAVAILAIATLAPIMLSSHPWPVVSRDLLTERGFADTGAENLVSAIYLGYRAYDTLGETIVLLAALAGAVSLIASVRSGDTEEARPAAGRRHTRTEILNVIAGKLAPIVLLFGAYVMLYGHASPGGGFQGGVVLASGIMFIALGRRSGGVGRIDPSLSAFGHASLARMEAWAFAAILILSFPGNGRAMEAIRDFAGSLGLAIPAVSYIIALNVIIGLKVGSGVALMCILMMGGEAE